MGLYSIKCRQCGTMLEIRENSQPFDCPNCNLTYIVDLPENIVDQPEYIVDQPECIVDQPESSDEKTFTSSFSFSFSFPSFSFSNKVGSNINWPSAGDIPTGQETTVNRLDREWEQSKEQYKCYGRYWRKYIPTKAGIIASSIVVALLGISVLAAWYYVWYGSELRIVAESTSSHAEFQNLKWFMDTIPLFILVSFPLLFFEFWRRYNIAIAYNKAHLAYQRERAELMAQPDHG